MVCCAGYSVIQTLGILLDIRKAKNTRLARGSCVFFTLLESRAITCSILSRKPFGIDLSQDIVDFGKYRAKVACMYLGTAH